MSSYEMRSRNLSSDVCSSYFSCQPRSLDDILRKDVGKIHVKVRWGDYVNVRTRQQERLTLSEYIERYVRPWEYDGRDIADTGSLPRYAGNTPLSRENFEALGFRYPECFEGDRKSDVEGKSVSVSVDLGGRRIIHKKKKTKRHTKEKTNKKE